MKGYFLTILFLMTGFVVLNEAKGCNEDWAEWAAFIPSVNKREYKMIGLNGKTEKKTLIVNIKEKKHQFKIDESCLKSFNQTEYKYSKTTIRCSYSKTEKTEFMFFCKQKSSTCAKDVSKKPFQVHETRRPFSVSVRSLSLQHAGTYWCGLTGEGRVYLKKINLEVKDVTDFRRSPTVGQNFTYFCEYNKTFSNSEIFICKGEDIDACERLVSTRNPDGNKRFFMDKNITGPNDKTRINITVREVTAHDAGFYWCGAEKSDNHREFFHRLDLIIVSPASSTTGASARRTIAAAEIQSGFGVLQSSSVGCIVLLLLLLLTAFILIFKRYSHSKNNGNRDSEQRPKEDFIYEEIQTPNSETIYSTVNFPTNNSTSLLYSTINFKSSSADKADGETLALQPSSSLCLYSDVRCPSSMTFKQPSTQTPEPLYSTVKKPQRK